MRCNKHVLKQRIPAKCVLSPIFKYFSKTREVNLREQVFFIFINLNTDVLR